MNSNWIRTALKYALLLAPTATLLGLIGLVALGARVAAILHDPSRFADAPILVQKFARAVYWHTRTHWQTVPDCAVFDRELLYRPRPGSCEFRNAEFATTMHFDDRGARATLVPRALAGTRPRLVILGDSHAMGWGVQDHETFAGVLASEYGYPTVNFGVSSFATPRELRRLERDFELRQDDIIIIQYSDNDLEENRDFLERGRVGPYQAAELEAMQTYRPTPAEALPIAGMLLRLIWRDVMKLLAPDRLLFGDAAEGDAPASPSATAAFLGVLESYPALREHRIMAVAVNGPDHSTHLSTDELRSAGIPLVVPAFDREDFFALDDHMRARGHRIVARAIVDTLQARQN